MELVAPVSTQYMLSNTPRVNIAVKPILMVTVFVLDQANTLQCGQFVICVILLQRVWPQGPVSAVAATDTFWKARSSSSTCERSRPRRESDSTLNFHYVSQCGNNKEYVNQ